MVNDVTNRSNSLFTQIKENIKAIPVKVKHEDNLITVSFQESLVCGISVEEETYRIFNVSSDWKEKTSYFCENSGDGTWYYYLETMDECIGEVRRLIVFEAQKGMDTKSPEMASVGRMAMIDSLGKIFSMITINDCDKNGKQYSNTRWLYPKGSDRFHNVFIEIWDKPRAKQTHVVFYRTLLTPEENKLAALDGNGKSGNQNRGRIIYDNISDAEIYGLIREKIKLYCETNR